MLLLLFVLLLAGAGVWWEYFVGVGVLLSGLLVWFASRLIWLKKVMGTNELPICLISDKGQIVAANGMFKSHITPLLHIALSDMIEVLETEPHVVIADQTGRHWKLVYINVGKQTVVYFVSVLEDQYAWVYELPMPSCFINKTGQLLAVNRYFLPFLENNWQSTNITQYISKNRLRDWNILIERLLLEDEETGELELLWQGQTGLFVKLFVRSHQEGFIVFLYDLSEFEFIKQQAQKAQNLQLLGQLSASVVHDFNNLLSAIAGFCYLLQEQLPAEHKANKDIREIQNSTSRAQELIKQLLLLTDKKPLNQLTDLNILIKECTQTFLMLLGPQVQLEVVIGKTLSQAYEYGINNGINYGIKDGINTGMNNVWSNNSANNRNSSTNSSNKNNMNDRAGLHPQASKELDANALEILQQNRARGSSQNQEHGSILVNLSYIQIFQILMNLIVNAKDANAKNIVISLDLRHVNAPIELRTGTLSSGVYMLLSVKDNGDGIPVEVQGKVLKEFFTTKETGSGIGLSTIARILMMHGGGLDFESNYDETSFRIYIPVHEEHAFVTEKIGEKDIHKPEIAQQESSTQAATNLESDNKKQKLADMSDQKQVNRKRILLVEDDALVRDLTMRALEYNNFEVVGCEDGLEALSVLNDPANSEKVDGFASKNMGKLGVKSDAKLTSKFNLLITDAIMPNMNGVELVHEAKNRFPDLQILFMSGLNSQELQEKLPDNVMILQKPIKIKDLMHILQEIL